MEMLNINDKVLLKMPVDRTWTNCAPEYGENPTPVHRLCARKSIGEVKAIEELDYSVFFKETGESFDFRREELFLVTNKN